MEWWEQAGDIRRGETMDLEKNCLSVVGGRRERRTGRG